ncbi:MAG TPA: hypothetical protein VFE62_20465 [Gemmataceae bacterium]|nr:hypothetical protein [Gemmataceae bacterium]
MSLTSINVERVDTRVVQVIYVFDGSHRLVQEQIILVGQLLELFINANPTNIGE